MNEIAIIVTACLTGAVAGGVFFGGLWWTVRKGLSARNPALLFLASYVVRTVVVGTVFFILFRNDWDRLGAAMLGFLVARVVVIRWCARAEEHKKASPRGDSHAN